MPEYLAPAVYVEETSFRSKSIEGVGTSTAAFVGLTSRGPVSAPGGVAPPLLTSFPDFERYYGGIDNLSISGNPAPNFVALAALAFFNNGGGRLYVARILGSAAAAATSGPLNPAPVPAAPEQVSIVARFAGAGSLPGRPGTNYSVRLTQSELASTKRLALRQPVGTMVRAGTNFFIMGLTPILTDAADLTAWNALGDDAPVTILSLGVEVTGPSGVIAEYAGLGFHSRHARYAGLVLGASPPVASDALTNPILLTIGASVDAFELRAVIFGATTERVVSMTGGSDGNGAPSTGDYQTALDRLLAIEDISIVAAPGSSNFAAPTPAAVNQMLIGHAEARRSYRIAVLDSPPNLDVAGVRGVKTLLDSKYAALYYPWVRIANPLASTDPTQPTEIDLPPSGFVCGIYARNDIQRGVHKAPANEIVVGALRFEQEVNQFQQELLNPEGINCLRSFPGRGNRVWGGRTLSSDPEWKYVNVRRYFLYLERSIDKATQWVVFEPNGERLWENVRTTVEGFLYNEWREKRLLGGSPKEAFFVRCDRSTMTQNDLDNGRLICLVGVAPLRPAEFVIFRVGQKTADA